ncbi:tripartite tricarboxylate transporter TctB family protein [Roseovarius sp. MMSF_3281]|uniref:tripartite tricarboxylate transporter TctB family protein n=1 Tax=Roseovarius sp. MMSF_3281 TaxID=3046694 RepID=UPI00273EF91F|nr:tripartite tricarboxylate transporter TctB family protein [Roseovarius sp. MMSF_3281]
MRTTDLLFSALYLGVLLIAFGQMAGLNENSGAVYTSAKLYPTLVLGIGLLVGVIETTRTLLTKLPADAPTFSVVWQHAFGPRRMLLLGLFVVYLLAIKPVGFLVATFVFCFATTAALAPVRGPRLFLIAGVVALSTLAVIYLLLVVYLEAFLP